MSQLSLTEWLEKLAELHPDEIELGLDRVKVVLERLSLPPLPNVVTVAGTNGKGSTIAMIEACLLELDQRVGAYTSPHLLAYNERVRLQGHSASDQQLIDGFEAVEAARQQTALTYFEFGTLAALWVFAHAQLDYVLLEVGLGGRLDAVNVIDPTVAVITTVDYDHKEWLGEDLQSIGFEKAGIIRQNGQVVLGDASLPSSVVQTANDLNAQVFRLGDEHSVLGNPDNSRMQVTFSRAVALNGAKKSVFSCPILKPYPLGNISAAVQTLALLGFEPGADLLTRAQQKIALRGRFEQVSVSPDVYLDVGHNPQAARYLAQQIKSVSHGSTRGKTVALYSALADKDYAEVTQTLAHVVDQWVCFPLDLPRALPVNKIKQALELNSQLVTVAPDIDSAISVAIEALSGSDRLIVFGSFYTVEAFIKSPAFKSLGMS